MNHNGSLDMALRLIDCAAEAAADAVKFQTFKAEKVVTAAAPSNKKMLVISPEGILSRRMPISCTRNCNDSRSKGVDMNSILHAAA